MLRQPTQEGPDLAAMQEWRRHIHQNPELGFEEEQTSEYVAQRLEAAGWTVTRGLGGTGVVGELTIGDGTGPVIGLRADMDALPIHEATGLPWASKTPGVMHACGHDGHTAMLLGGADLIARRARAGAIKGAGRIVAVFQPAEELGDGDSGAVRMIRDGLFERFGIEEIYGIHNGPTEPEGHVMCRTGALLYSCDRAKITIRGRSSHTATPHFARDAGLAMAATALALNSVVNQDVPSHEPALIGIGIMNSGRGFNVISDEAVMELTLRALEPHTALTLHKRVEEVVKAQAAVFGCEAEMELSRGNPATVNSAEAIELVARVAERVVGPEKMTRNAGTGTASEDFAHYLLHRPGAFFMIGNGENGHLDGQPCGVVPVHNPRYDFNDRILGVGAEMWASIVAEKLGG